MISSPGDAAHLASQVGQIGLEAILALIVTFYFLVDGPMLRDRTIQLLPAEHRARTIFLTDRIHEALGKWLRGQAFLIVLVIGVLAGLIFDRFAGPNWFKRQIAVVRAARRSATPR